MEDKTASEGSSFQVIILSFASQKNDMLLRNMIYRLHADMIGSTSSNMIFLTSSKVIDGLLPLMG